MGKRGPKSVKKKGLPAQGNIPDPPKWLDGVGLVEWIRVRDLLQSRGLLSAEDWAILNVYGGSIQMMDRAACVLAEHGITSIAKNGMEIQHSAVGTFNKAGEQMIRVAARLGLSPADRASMTAPDNSTEANGKGARFFKVVR
ncbi:phage terminase small subunit P27 family [bacterium]|nr:phage terminase small subunit P27 family [bacterium]